MAVGYPVCNRGTYYSTVGSCGIFNATDKIMGTVVRSYRMGPPVSCLAPAADANSLCHVVHIKIGRRQKWDHPGARARFLC